MITIKNPEEFIFFREGGRRLAEILDRIARAVHPGVTAKSLDDMAYALILEKGDSPSFLNYQPEGSKKKYPASLCVSVNDEVVHGIPGERIIKNGDIVGLDLGLKHNGFFLDGALSIGAGKISDEVKKLIEITKKALYEGISQVKEGAYTGDIGAVIAECVRPYGYGVIKELAGHGVGYAVHEEPAVFNYGKTGEGTILKAGMIIAIEPMISLTGNGEVKLQSDGFTFVTKNGSICAHFEHTVLVTKNGAEILTEIK